MNIPTVTSSFSLAGFIVSGCVSAMEHHGNISVQKMIPDFHLTYSKNGGNLGSQSK